ncbi:hypothetical protein D3C85_1072150 [compost metagenome]
MQRRIKLDLPDAETNITPAMHSGLAIIEPLFKPCLDRREIHAAGASQQRNKGRAFQPADHIAFPETNAQHIGKGFQGVVALGAAKQVVDAFELIEVEKQQRRRPLQLCAGLQPHMGQCNETVAIG